MEKKILKFGKFYVFFFFSFCKEFETRRYKMNFENVKHVFFKVISQIKLYFIKKKINETNVHPRSF